MATRKMLIQNQLKAVENLATQLLLHRQEIAGLRTLVVGLISASGYLSTSVIVGAAKELPPRDSPENFNGSR